MFDQNDIIITGRLGQDVKVQDLPGGNRFASFSLAHDRNYKDSSGKYHTDTHWIPVVTSQPYLIDNILAEHGKKGTLLFVHGALRENTYNNKHVLQVVVDGKGGIAPIAKGMSENTVMLAGRLGDNAKITTLPGEKTRKVASMSVAVSRGYKDGQGNWPADWIRVCTFQPSLIDKTLAKSALKGRTVFVTGSLRVREYTDEKTGEIKSAYEVEVETATGIKPIVHSI